MKRSIPTFLAALALVAPGPLPARDFVRGDSTDDALVNLTDPVFTLLALSTGGAQPLCGDAADANDDGEVYLDDSIYTLSFLFQGGPPLPLPGLECGPDETDDSLLCLAGETCTGVVEPPVANPPDPEELDKDGVYSPYFTTGELHRPRYLHEVVLTRSGTPIALGGTDERGYSALDTVEMFAESSVDRDRPAPVFPNVAGVWIDTDFEGNPIRFRGGPRIRFTASLLADGRILVAGGSSDLVGGRVHATAEVYDGEMRTFEVIESEMVLPRFRHTATALDDGTILLVGGQVAVTVLIPDEEFPEARVTRFPTTQGCELFSLAERRFLPLTFPGTDQWSPLATPRGRSGHATERIAGPDGRLRTEDDLFIVAGGFQGFEGQFGPVNKLHGAVGGGRAEGLTSIEAFDPAARTFFQVAAAELAAPRINDPYIVNLGQFNDTTPDGVPGMGNVLLVTHGNDDDSFATVVADDLLAATFTGFGPAQGLQLFRIIEDRFQSHSQGAEYRNAAPAIEPRANLVGRCGTNPVVLRRSFQTDAGVEDVVTWAVSAGGVDMVPGPEGATQSFGPTVRAGCVFDPFFSLPALALGRTARDLGAQRSAMNPSGVVGCWLTLDGALPTVDAANFGATPAMGWAQTRAPRRVHGRNVPLRGKDRTLHTPDDLILLTGGSVDYGDPLNAGGEPTAPSAEILVPPGANAEQPSP